ncbi:hypothetical protein ACFT9I_23805 [Streptomyces sp. NPDC057137]|uniref:hypothetical protein n=1 Tax=Streptomyces sp. NPDC057137 TaxID=3346030 RepID=UPI00362B3AA4
MGLGVPARVDLPGLLGGPRLHQRFQYEPGAEEFAEEPPFRVDLDAGVVRIRRSGQDERRP